MSTTYGTASSITIPSDGDTIDAADVNTPLAALWDQHDLIADLTALKAILVPTHGLTRYVRGYGHYVFVTSGTYSASTAVSPWILTATDGTAGRWVADQTADANKQVVRSRACTSDFTYGQADVAKTETLPTATRVLREGGTDILLYGDSLRFNVATAGSAIGRHVFFPLKSILVNGATIDTAKLFLQPVVAHAALPAMMPAMSIVRVDPSTGTQDSLRGAGMTDDASAGVGAYNARHAINVTCDQKQTVDLGTYEYFAVACNEGDTNAVAELQFFGIQITMTTKGYL
jgi:hypothetical protein